MDGIERAGVQIDEAETDGFPRAKKRITAAVMVRPDRGGSLDAATVSKIKQMMAGSVAGLEADAVTVVDMRSVLNAPATGAGGGGQVAAPVARPSGPAADARPWRAIALAWLSQHPDVAILGGLAVVALLALGSIVRPIGGANNRATMDTSHSPPPHSQIDGESQESDVPREPPRRRSAPRATLSSELTDAVRHDPDAAVSVLRTWIGNAS
jgi:flagellar biosynthesis/type III secretory pathway M-ring protein FliF/YscJ